MAKKKHSDTGVQGREYTGKQKVYLDRLVELRDTLVDEIREMSGYGLANDHQAGEELADVGSENFQRDMELGLMSEEGDRFKAVQAAIGRLERGEYGVCADCGETIPEGRLEAIPYARYCVVCKSKKEDL